MNIACGKGHWNVAELLLVNGADPNTNDKVRSKLLVSMNNLRSILNEIEKFTMLGWKNSAQYDYSV